MEPFRPARAPVDAFPNLSHLRCVCKQSREVGLRLSSHLGDEASGRLLAHLVEQRDVEVGRPRRRLGQVGPTDADQGSAPRRADVKRMSWSPAIPKNAKHCIERIICNDHADGCVVRAGDEVTYGGRRLARQAQRWATKCRRCIA